MPYRIEFYAVVLILGSFRTACAAAADCSVCHPAEAKAHAETRHAVAMVRAGGSEFVKNLPANRSLRESANGYSFLYRTTPDGVEVTAFQGDRHAEGVIEWVMGAGEQGQTPLVRTDAGILESRVSYFPRLRQYGITIGQEPGSSPSPAEALGLHQNATNLKSCLSCHATAITQDLEPVIPGIQCQRCHAGADQHAMNPGKRLPFNPGKLTAEAQVRFCGNCHRVVAPGKESDPDNVRFQPLRLMKSRCFQSGKLACLTCHAAHRDVRRADPAYYNAKCLNCHAEVHHDDRRHGNCIECHMPRAQIHPALMFTDHFIRVAVR